MLWIFLGAVAVSAVAVGNVAVGVGALYEDTVCVVDV